MSDFAVERRVISTVSAHPNADRLDLCTVSGLSFQFVTGRNEYLVGDPVIYFPVDSLLPEWLIETMGLVGRLSGSQKNRVKTVKLRGEISQGLVASFDTLPLDEVITEQTDYTDILGVTKYEPPIVQCNNANLHRLPEGVSTYDIQGADRHIAALVEFGNQDVLITEKLEGQHYSITLDGDAVHVCQRNHEIIPKEGGEHVLIRVTREQGIIEAVDALRTRLGVDWLTLRGEAIGPGIQKNIYGLSTVQIRFFDILTKDGYLPGQTFLDLADEVSLKIVPCLYVGELSEYAGLKAMVTIQDASTGNSALVPSILREGIVIRPYLTERRSEILKGRLIIKQRSPEYLATNNF